MCFSAPTPPRSSPLLFPLLQLHILSLSLILSLSVSHVCVFLSACLKHTHTHTKPLKPLSLFLLTTIPQHRACHGMWLIYPVTEHWRNLLSLYKETTIANRFLFMARTLYLFPPLSAGILCGLNLCGSYSICEFIYASVLLCLEDSFSLKSSSASST